MPSPHHTHTTAAALPWWRRHVGGHDRGDSPVPSAIIIAGLAIIAIGLLAWLLSYVGGFMDAAPTELPGGDAG